MHSDACLPSLKAIPVDLVELLLKGKINPNIPTSVPSLAVESVWPEYLFAQERLFRGYVCALRFTRSLSPLTSLIDPKSEEPVRSMLSFSASAVDRLYTSQAICCQGSEGGLQLNCRQAHLEAF